MLNAAKPLAGKNIVFTGGTSGIGVEVMTSLARMGASLFLVANDRDKAKTIIERAGTIANSGNIYLLRGNLSSLDSVAGLAEQLKELHIPFDILINNAGLFGLRKRILTVDNLETTMFVNYFAHYLLTMKLLERLKASGAGRIINVSSLSYVRITQKNFEKTFANYNADAGYDYNHQYSLSKLALIYFARELAARTRDAALTVNCLHPGMVLTDMGKNVNPVLMFTLRTFFPFLWKTAAQSAQTYLHLCTSPCVAGTSGELFYDRAIIKLNRTASNEEQAARFWALSQQVVADYL